MQQYELEQFGVVRTDHMRYAPLDHVSVTFTRLSRPGASYEFQVFDGAGRLYYDNHQTAPHGRCEFAVTAGGAPGLHIIRVFAEGADRNSFCPTRMGSFIVEAKTGAWAEGVDMAAFFTWLRDGLDASTDWALYNGKWIAGDKCADNSPMNLAYPRFRLDSTIYLEDAERLKGHLELAYANQKPDGSLYDHIYADRHPGWAGQRMIRSMMADMETGLIINVHQVWMATGDTDWMAGLIEPMRRGFEYATTSHDLWSERYGLIKKPHTADEWDSQMGDGSCFCNENSKYAVACCDAVRLPKAADALAHMLDALGRRDEAASLRAFAQAARERANQILWDGTKYRHHQHIDPVDHGDFDEDDQLVMSNTWACNDGLASHEQAVSIIEEYERRLAATGDRYPWWSLQPPYPEGHFPKYPPGVYMNGGLYPWVGGQLCRACFGHGFAERGWRLWQEFWEQVKADQGACPTWYTLDGRAAANTPWTTNYDAWGIASWGQAVIEGLVGVAPLAPAMERCRCAPQWAAGGVRRARACIAMPASRSYFAYQYSADDNGVALRFTGSGESVDIEFPLAAAPQCQAVNLDGLPIEAQIEEKHGEKFICVSLEIEGAQALHFQT